MDKRILTNELHLPALYLISIQEGEINTTILKNQLKKLLKPTGKDLKILKGRNDPYFDQIVRNLTGNERTFVKNSIILRDKKKNSPLYLGNEGKKILSDNENIIDQLKYLFSHGFSQEELSKNINDIYEKVEERSKLTFDENIKIEEGLQKEIKSKVFRRSKKLREKAIEHFTTDGHILCRCCSFNFYNFYGHTGKGFIEIHHIKPIFQYKSEDLNITLNKALENLAPVCSNCHRMIHRNWNNPLEIQHLKEIVNTFGVYNR